MVAIEGRLVQLRVRRAFSVLMTAASTIGIYVLAEYYHRTLRDPAIATGWTLLASTVGLYALGLRKRAIARRIGPVAAWLQFHTYLGSFALIAFCLHVGWPIRGVFELALAGMFLFISVSGIALIIFSRRIPKLLSSVKSDYRLEDIPVRRERIASEVHQLALEASELGEGATLAEFYQRKLLSFFHTPRSQFYRWIPTGFKRRRMLRELEDLDRYLDESGRQCRLKLTQLVSAKDDLDFHEAMQLRLRFLVLSHVAFTWSLLLMIVVHVAMALQFQGAIR